MRALLKRLGSQQRGAALIIVLAFVVLFAGVGVAYLSRTTGDRQVAQSSFNQSNVDQLVQSAVDNIIGDLRQEITNGSTAVTQADGTTLYTPTAAANMVPQRSGNAAGAPTLIRRSVRSDTLSGNPAPPSRASAVNSQDDLSANGRSISSTRWNGHYLVPKGDTTTNNSSPIPAFTNATPDWVFVTDAGATVIPTPNSSVIGRYAYAVYAEGGLLDMNVAGYPTGTTTTQSGRKGSVAFADLSALGSYGITNGGGDYQIDRLLGWRNYATTNQSGTVNNNFPDSLPANKAFARTFQVDATGATSYFNYIVSNTKGFLGPTATIAPNGRTDQAFLGRQQLIAYRKTPNTNNGTPIANTSQFNVNALQYLSTFSRETNAPSFSPSTPPGSSIDYAALANNSDAVNPNVLSRRVTTGFNRFGGTLINNTFVPTQANPGEPLVNARFPLARLAWITYKGPSALRTLPPQSPTLQPTDPDYDMWALQWLYGIPASYLKAGTAADVKACFGLTFPTGGTAGSPWMYTNPTGTTAASRILRLDEVAAAAREPDFFELLQAGILSGSLGQNTGGGVTGGNVFPDVHMNNSTHHILSIGAAIIDQADPDSIPMRIQFNPSGTLWTAYGVENLPYITQMYPISGTSPNTPSQWATYLNFQLWNPHQNAPTTGYPVSVRMRVDGAVGIFGDGGNSLTWATSTNKQTYTIPLAGVSVRLNSAASFSAPAPLTNIDTTDAAAAPGTPGVFATLAAPPIPP